MGLFDFALDFGKGLGDSLGTAADVASKASDGLGWLNTAGKLAGAVGNVAGLFGGGGNENNDVGTGKIYTRPMEENIADMEKLRAYLAKNRQGIQIPTRRLTSEEMADTTFAPRGVMALQRAMDDKRAAQAQAAQAAPVAPVAPTETTARSVANPLLAQTMERLRMLGGNPETDMSADAKAYRQNLHDLMVMKDMDGYKNEYTGGVFDLTDYLNNMNTALDERAMMGNGGGIVDYSTPAYTKATNAYSQQRDNALRRPKEMDLIAPLVAAAITGGAGLWGSGAALAGGVGAGKVASTALGLGQRLAGK